MTRNFRYIIGLLVVYFAGCGLVAPGDRESGDAQVIAALKAAGSDLSKPHRINFYFVEFPDRASAEMCGKGVSDGWQIEIHRSPNSTDWTLVASTVMVPDLEPLTGLSEHFSLLATRHGGDYDGWEAAVTP